jgi:hypothetical protein
MLKNLLVIGLLCASLGLAQRGNRGGGDTSGAPVAMGGATSKLDNIAITLNLNKDQKKAVKGILDDGAKEAAPLRDQISKSRVAVGEAVGAKKSDDEIKQAVKASADLSVQLTHLELQAFAKIIATLDDSQKANRQGMGRVLVLMTNIFATKNWNED